MVKICQWINVECGDSQGGWCSQCPKRTDAVTLGFSTERINKMSIAETNALAGLLMQISDLKQSRHEHMNTSAELLIERIELVKENGELRTSIVELELNAPQLPTQAWIDNPTESGWYWWTLSDAPIQVLYLEGSLFFKSHGSVIYVDKADGQWLRIQTPEVPK